MSTWTFPTYAELTTIEQEKVPRLTKDRPIFRYLPLLTKASNKIKWEQKDKYKGLQQVRGLNNAPSRVKRVGTKMYEYAPGVYGEYIALDEKELTDRRAMGSYDRPVDISDLVLEAQDQLLQRRLDRIEKIGWDALRGQFSVATEYGPILHMDSFPVQTYSAGVAWSDHANSTPLADLRAIQLLGRGTSSSFGTGAEFVINLTDWNHIIGNQNPNDLGGRLGEYGIQVTNSMERVNSLLSQLNLPNFVVYDEGYIDESDTFQLFVTTGNGILIGRRPGNVNLGNYLFTRNASNANMEPGPYMFVIDSKDMGRPIPRTIEVHDGHNGGPLIEYPSAIINVDIG